MTKSEIANLRAALEVELGYGASSGDVATANASRRFQVILELFDDLEKRVAKVEVATSKSSLEKLFSKKA